MIQMNDFTRAEPALRERELAACARVLASGWSILGREVEAFESAWAKRIGAPFAIGVGNGLDALEIALRAHGIGPGDQVITTPMTAFATVLAILRAGAEPVLADIDPGTACLSLESAERCRGPRTRAVILVHLYGQIVHPERWQAWCSANSLVFIEDCAQAHLASWQGARAGTWGAAAGWSFYPTKNLGACGDAGAVTVGDADVAERCRRLRNYGQSERYHHPELGMNSRLDELQAALLSERLALLGDWTNRRQVIAGRYHAEIHNERIALLNAPLERDAHVYHLFVIICDQRERLIAHLKSMGVQTLIHYPVPLHHQKPMATVVVDPAGLARTEQHASRCLSLPCHPYLNDDEVDSVIAAVNAFR